MRSIEDTKMVPASQVARHRQAEISINGRFATQKMTGVQRYAHEIVSGLDDLLLENIDVANRLRLKLLLPKGPSLALPNLRSIEVCQTKRLSGHLWDQISLPFHEKDGTLSLGNFGPLLSRSHIVCIHDANTFIERDSYSRLFGSVYRTLLPLVGRRARRVATVSEFSAQMLVKFGISSAEKIFVAHNGHEHVLRWDSQRANLPLLETQKRPFVLLLGSKAKHKNTAIVTNAARALDEAGLDLVVVGAAAGIFSDTDGDVESPNVRYTGHIGDNDLAALYAKALCLAFPSKTEGFGIPPLEAMALGCPVVSSNAASLTEVGGDAVLYVDPTDGVAWRDCIVELSKNQDRRLSMIQKGRRQAERFSWKKSASLYLEEMLRLTA